MADSGQTQQEAEPIHVAKEPSNITEPVEESLNKQENAAVVDRMATSEQAAGEGGNQGEEQAQSEREGSGEQVGEDGAVDQAKDDSSTKDGVVVAHVSESPLEQDPGIEPGSGMGVGPKASEMGPEGEDSDGGQVEGPPVEKELSGTGGPSAGSEPSAVEEQKDEGGDARDKGDDAKDEGGDVRDEGGDSRDEGGDARDKGSDARDEGDDAKDESKIAKGEGDIVKAEDEVTKEDVEVIMKDEGEAVKDVAVEEAAGYECLEEEVGMSREEIIAHLREALATQEQLKAVNAQYQHKIAEYLAKKKVCTPCPYTCAQLVGQGWIVHLI